MTLENILRTKLAEAVPSAGAHSVVVPHHDWTVTLQVERGDALSCQLWAVELRRATPLPGDVKAWASRVADRVTGLLESLRVQEVDLQLQQALLRSDAPTSREGGVCYYEANLHNTSLAQLKRYRGYADSDQRRSQIAFVLTHEALAKLIEDMTAAK